ncbi:MAG: winged helix-turn-helix transcriptional regulator [Clostridia bacterium]|nr:winged helix-turn-helix transcriptional regulator [Clostridia bacterium]
MKEIIQPTTLEISKVANLFKIIGDSTRLKLIYALQQSPMSVNDLAKATNSSQSLVSHQLKTLRENHIVGCKKQGNFVTYYLIDDHIDILLNVCRIHINEKEDSLYED